MILGEEAVHRSPPRARAPRADRVDPSDREAFVVTLPKQLLAESTAPWPSWLAPPGSPPRLSTPISGGYSAHPEGPPAPSGAPYARRSSLEIPAPARA